MKELKKHIHGISAAGIFIFICFVVLILTGFSTPLPLPDEESVIIDFTNSENVDMCKSDLSESNKSCEGSNSESSNEIISDNSSDVYFTSGHSNDENLDKINNLFDNPFGKVGKNDHIGDNPFGEEGNNNKPSDITGKLDKSRTYTGEIPTAKDNMFGKVVLEIIVDEKGNVTSIMLKSTTCNECVQAAKEAVAKWKYEPRPGAGLQSGTIIIEFKQI